MLVLNVMEAFFLPYFIKILKITFLHLLLAAVC